MRQFLFPRHPLPRRTLLFCHAIIQLGLLVAGGLWLAPRTPWLADTTWLAAWPRLALGGGVLLLAMVGVRLIAELWLLPYHLAGLRPGFAPGDVVTRSFDRRPAVHDSERAWTSSARSVSMDDEVIGSARVSQPASRQRHAGNEPTLNPGDGEAEPYSRHEPRL
ncbi:hypothetical protein [Halomonas elongata]|uniref:Uncharacterized protein n=1 Tax=Halomonas elongata (strain ATCC 33173 / DSM 2581 / NBRC 15536 / NCIMB 2198 / 1H9) TaxID=768066 RepID=E1V4D7_HALED|nr:hypothetical protein [Halomonas elongata]WBF18214.1 hypothetical protein LM502_00470 [Halomonas elongata]WPU47065.1 hypothetical protein SR933_17735 [Halomonas elongata DSM 2581]CBV40974.1 uncharacterized protein HELO_1091 [Halomonas elongata DSM 2581]